MRWPLIERREATVRRTDGKGTEGRPSQLQWELLLDSGRSGTENMALDQALLEEADRSGRAFLRLYRFDPPCLSLGRHEAARDRYDRDMIGRLGLDVVRRPTGGRAVWHEHEVTYAVAAPVAVFGSLRESYLAIHDRLAAALRSLGVPATLARAVRTHRLLGAGACFAAPVGGEVLVDGRKVIGSAQLRYGSAFLQHGSILLDGSQETVRMVSREHGAGSCETTLAAALGRPVSFEEVADAIVTAWGHDWTSAAPYRLLPPSTALFSDPAWTWRR